MPSAYAHEVFGERVFLALPTPLSDLITHNHNAFCIGLQGPDILFYHKPLGNSEIRHRGSQLHEEIAADFLDHAVTVIQNGRSGIAAAYTLGYLCHFMLDSTCHGYIKCVVGEGLLSHTTIETEFERFCMELDGINPLSHDPTAQILLDECLCEKIAPLYTGITPEELYDSLRSMKRCNKLLLCPQNAKRAFLLKGMGLISPARAYREKILLPTANPDCAATNLTLHTLFEAAIPATVQMLRLFTESLQRSAPLDERLYRNFE